MDKGNLAAARETKFHDHWAGTVDIDKIVVSEMFESLTSLENRFILGKMGDLRGKRLLDIGCGYGESSVYFALKGAEVSATDLSPKMLEQAAALAKRHRTSVKFIASSAEDLSVPDDHFDFIYSANTLHHVFDRDRFLEVIRRALKPGAFFFFWDPLAYNPAINVYRRMATEVRTKDEAPITYSELRRVARSFPQVRHQEFWILGLALFLKYFILDRIHPNQDRYWKRIFRETPRSLWWWRPLAALDVFLTRLPFIRCLAWNIVIWGPKT